MAQYHVTEKGPRFCTTTPDRCPYGRQGEPHFDNISEAQGHYETKMEEKHGLVATATAKAFRDNSYYKFYSFVDRLEASHPAVAISTRFANYRRADSRRRYLKPGSLQGATRSKMRRQGFVGQVGRINRSRGSASFTALDETPRSVEKFLKNLQKG